MKFKIRYFFRVYWFQILTDSNTNGCRTHGVSSISSFEQNCLSWSAEKRKLEFFFLNQTVEMCKK